MDDILTVEDLRTEFHTVAGVITAVAGASFAVPRGKTVCLVGESGCGKSITARSILQIVERPGQVAGGSMIYVPEPPAEIDLATLGRTSSRMRDIRGPEIAMIFQEPMSSQSPVHTVGRQITEMIRLHSDLDKKGARKRAIELCELVGLPRPDQVIDRYTFQLSGGQRQRAMIAMALSCSPRLLIADEPTTALDVTTQAQILELIAQLQTDLGMTVLFITHDLGVVAQIADEVVVMYLGKVVEQGPVTAVFTDPQHPYTKALLRSVPRLGHADRLASIRGTVPSPFERPTGCPFHPRCDDAVPGRCDTQTPEPVPVSPRHQASCLLIGDPPAAGEPTQVAVR